MLATLTACDMSADTPDVPVYTYPALDMEGGSLRVLHPTSTRGICTDPDYELQSGDALDDAVFERNRLLEERFHFRFDFIEKTPEDCVDGLRTAILSGEDDYDAALVPSEGSGQLFSEGFFYNLRELPEFRLDEVWWEQSAVREAAITDDAVFFLPTDFTLDTLESAQVIFFNETMSGELDLEPPYKLVKSGKWTLDALLALTKAADGRLSASDGFSHAMIIGAGARFMEAGANGKPEFSLESDRFYTLVSKFTQLAGSGIDSGAGRFASGGALFLGAPLATARSLGDSGDRFGILPIPKLDETQESYYSLVSESAPVLCIPVTTPNPDAAAIIMDAAAYESFTGILPLYCSEMLGENGKFSKESAAMLEIVRATRVFDIGCVFGLTDELRDKVCRALDAGGTDIAPIIAAHKDAAAAAIKATMEMFD